MSNVEINNAQKGNEIKDGNPDEVAHEDLVDPRVQIELERLNTATDLINKLEIELDEARSNFRLLLSESSIRVNQLAKKLGTCVEKARPYYESRMHAKQLQTQTQKAALRYERASSAHSAAKEMVFLAEEGLKKEGRCFDPAWQEMLNHATLRVNEAESERVLSQHEHQKSSLAYNEAEKIVQHLHQELKKSIVKSSLSTRRSLLQLNNLANQHQLQLLPYFEMKAQFNQLLEEQRKKVHCLEENVLKMKMSYADALHNLEEISDEIHKKRNSEQNQTLPERSEGVGAESISFSSENVKIPYHKLKTCTSFSEDICMKNFNSEDVFMSLPSKLKLKPGMIPGNCAGSSSENIYQENYNTEDEYMSLPSKLKLKPGMIATGCIENSSESITFPLMSEQEYLTGGSGKEQHHKNRVEKTASDMKENRVNLVDSSIPISNNLEQLNLINNDYCYDDKSNEIQDKSLEGELPDYKFLAPDFNILRVQREEISDSESLASNDTTDTLDDNQIECLLLEKIIPLDLQDIDRENCFDSSKSNDNIHL